MTTWFEVYYYSEQFELKDTKVTLKNSNQINPS